MLMWTNLEALPPTNSTPYQSFDFKDAMCQNVRTHQTSAAGGAFPAPPPPTLHSSTHSLQIISLAVGVSHAEDSLLKK